MKVLSMNIHFLLPDNFNGNLNDALEEIIKYRKSKNLTKYKAIELDRDDKISRWQTFLSVIQEGFRLYGGIFVGEWNSENKKWVRTACKNIERIK